MSISSSPSHVCVCVCLCALYAGDPDLLRLPSAVQCHHELYICCSKGRECEALLWVEFMLWATIFSCQHKANASNEDVALIYYSFFLFACICLQSIPIDSCVLWQDSGFLQQVSTTEWVEPGSTWQANPLLSLLWKLWQPSLNEPVSNAATKGQTHFHWNALVWLCVYVLYDTGDVYQTFPAPALELCTI